MMEITSPDWCGELAKSKKVATWGSIPMKRVTALAFSLVLQVFLQDRGWESDIASYFAGT